MQLRNHAFSRQVSSAICLDGWARIGRTYGPPGTIATFRLSLAGRPHDRSASSMDAAYSIFIALMVPASTPLVTIMTLAFVRILARI